MVFWEIGWFEIAFFYFVCCFRRKSRAEGDFSPAHGSFRVAVFGVCESVCVFRSWFYRGQQVGLPLSGLKTQYTPKIAPTNSPALTDFVVILGQNTSLEKTMQALFEKICTFFVTNQKTGIFRLALGPPPLFPAPMPARSLNHRLPLFLRMTLAFGPSISPGRAALRPARRAPPRKSPP